MTSFPKIRVLLAVSSVATVAVLSIGLATTSAKCQHPNPNEKLCKTLPDDAVKQCDGTSSTLCLVAEVAVYDIKPFPDGAVDGGTTYTTTTFTDCWRKQGCRWDTAVSPQRCVAGSWLPGGDTYYQAAKTVSSTQCSEE